MIALPEGAAKGIRALEAAGYEAWAVGGCVRDSLLHVPPHDWDICTGALPNQTLEVFKGRRVVLTGLRHGTVTVLMEDGPLEVTTFRVDGTYSDSRRPDSVAFVTNLREDLSRRDFTVNAMAYHPERGLYDAFGGKEDLQNKLIRCVGDPALRFTEDALRILRALRFASTYGFSIEEKTGESLLSLKERLHAVAPERIREEFLRLLCGPGAAGILRKYAPVFFVFLPELAPMVGLDQHNPYHHLDVWEHTLSALGAVPPDAALRFAMLMHDAGKPACFFRDANGVGHFYGHPKVSGALAEKIMARLRFDNRTKKTVEELVLFHDVTIPAREKSVRKWLNRLGEERLWQLLAIKRADAAGQSPDKREKKLAELIALEACLRSTLNKKLPYALKDLAVTGEDLKAAGIPPGPEMGRLLQALLNLVMAGDLPNEKAALLDAAARGAAPGTLPKAP